ncbi:MAG: response regulator [Chitinophagaceae bacterium]
MSPLTKVLIVDDEVDICYFLSRSLIKRNFTTSFTHTISDAEKIIEEEVPSILLLDNHLPDGLGINFLLKIRNKYPDLKVIVITAHDSPQDRTKAYNNGANYFLSKPFTLTEINNVVDLLITNDNLP